MKKPFVPQKYLKLYEETARQKVLQVLFQFPEKEFSLSDLAKEANVAKANIGRILDELYSIEFIEITKLSKIWRIKANQGSWQFVRGKIVYNLDFIYNSGLVEFLNEHFNNPKAIVLFGSFRKGEDISGSDIDIAIESDDFTGYDIASLKELVPFENETGRKIQLHLFNRKEIDINVFNNIANGIVLLGFLVVNK
jgi:predicted nucleotidyltransferase